MAFFGYGALFAITFTGITNVYVLMIPAFFIMSAMGMLNVIITVFLANTVDYGEWKNHRRDESVIFSMQTFVVKLSSGVAALAASFVLQIFGINNPHAIFRACGLSEELCYHFYNLPKKINVKEFGDLVNTIAPIHIRQDSLVHHLVARFVKMEEETEDLQAYGDELMYAGVKLKQAFAATGYNEEVRFFPDFASRMYFMEAVKETTC